MLGGLSRLECLVYAIGIYFLLPLAEALRSGLALSRRQVRGEDGLGPEYAQVLKVSSQLAIRVVQVGPAGDVCLGYPLQNGQCGAPVASLYEWDGLFRHLAHRPHDAAHVPVGFGHPHAVEGVEDRMHVPLEVCRVNRRLARSWLSLSFAAYG